MKPAMFLRIASIVALVQCVAHTYLLVSYVPTHGPEEVALVEAMKLHRFNFGSTVHSYWELYFGYGLFAAVNCLIEAVLFWQLAALAKTDSVRIRPIVALFLLANVGYAILVWNYFFLTPIVPDTAIVICLGLTLITLSPNRAKERQSLREQHR